MESLSPPAAVPFEFARAHGLLPLSPDPATAAESATLAAVRCLAPASLAAGGLAGVPSASTAAADNLSLFVDAPLDLVPTPEAELRAAIREAYEGRMAQTSPLAAAEPGTNDGAAIALRPDVAAELAALADRDSWRPAGRPRSPASWTPCC
jgi:hypothetical protein